MTALRHGRAAHKTDEEAPRRPAQERDEALSEDAQAGTPAVPNLDSGPLEPEAWLALQQTIGNSAVGGLVERRKAGQSLPANTRHDMEAAFGQDFGQVQIQSGPEVDQAAEALDAAAFTVGEDVYIHSDVPGFDQPFGRELLGEELAHVAQGVGRHGTERVTAPGETAERQAHAAGRAAAAGEHTELASAPEASGAVARFGLADVAESMGRAAGTGLRKMYDSAFGGPAEAKQIEKAELSDEDKERLRAGVLEPLKNLTGELQKKIGAKATTPKDLQPIADESAGLPAFVLSFQPPAGLQGTFESVFEQMARGQAGIFAAIDPGKLLMDAAGNLANGAAEIRGLAAAPQASAPPAPAAPGQAVAQGLTSSEAEQLIAGAATPLETISDQLKGEAPDYPLILGRLRSIPDLLRSYGKTPELKTQFHRLALGVKANADAVALATTKAQDALQDAWLSWSTAVSLLAGLASKPAGGAGSTSETVKAGDAGDDEDKKKPT